MITKLLHQIHMELEAAEDYIHCASHSTGDELDVYRGLAKEELNHMEKLMNLGKARKERGQLDEKCLIIWDYEKDIYAAKLLKLRAECSLLS